MSLKLAVLCVDDEKTILDSLKAELISEFDNDFVMEFAESCNEAFEIIDELIIDGIEIVIIVSDWLMPGMKGDEFLIKIHKTHPKITKIMLTGQADNDAIERVRKEANLYRCFSKPWDKTEFIGTIRFILQKNNIN